MKFFNQKYNIKFLEAPEEGSDINNTESSFCSELASKFFESLDIKITDKLKRKVFPCDFDRFFDSVSINSDWINVTEISLYTTNFTEPLSYQDSAFLKLPKFP